MTRTGRTGRRGAVLVAAAMAVLVGCVWPSAWSPDSKRVILPVMMKNTLNLLMVDAAGKTVRRVAWSDSDETGYSSATWSPDGGRIAFEKLSGMRDAEGRHTAVVVQDAQTGKDEVVWEGKESEEEALGASWVRGPVWVKGGAALVFWESADNETVLLDLKSRKTIPLPVPREKWPRITAAPSPDGSRVAYVRVAKETTALHVVTVADGKGTSVPVQVQGDEADFSPLTTYPVWSADGASVFLPTELPPDGDKERCALVRYDVAGGKLDRVWEGEGTLGMPAVSTGTGKVAVAREQGGGLGLLVIDPATARATPVHFDADERFIGLGISPDGKWVSFTPLGAGKDVSAGAIVASDGSGLRAFQTVPEGGVDLTDVVAARLSGALRAAGADELAKELGSGKGPAPDKLPAALAALDRFAAAHGEPIFKEAAAGGKAILSVRAAADNPEQAAELRRQAQPYVDKWLAFYPQESLRAELQAAIEKGIQKAP